MGLCYQACEFSACAVHREPCCHRKKVRVEATGAPGAPAHQQASQHTAVCERELEPRRASLRVQHTRVLGAQSELRDLSVCVRRGTRQVVRERRKGVLRCWVAACP